MTKPASNIGQDSPHNQKPEYEAPVECSAADEALIASLRESAQAAGDDLPPWGMAYDGRRIRR
jgi:hypothetical protein